MQIRGTAFSRLRQKLRELTHAAPREIGTFLSSEPIVKGSVYTLRRRCSKPSCRCARGEKHETVVMTASIGGKTRLWTLSSAQIPELRRRTERYRQFRTGIPGLLSGRVGRNTLSDDQRHEHGGVGGPN